MATARPPTAGDERWHAALEAVGATTIASPGAAEETFDALAAHHGTGVRHYHTFDHAVRVVDTVLSIHEPGDDWAVPVLGAWYHDAVYESTAPPGANEGASAALAVRDLERLGAAHAAVGAVARIICLTADHHVRDGDRPGALLCDADLAVLAGKAEDYDAYVDAVRAEYAHVDDDAWRQGRGAVLRGLLDRPWLFHTPYGHQVWEQRARTNISRELERLT